jgi:lactate dehydrogenase-like 2-hydroxyacid dehydrogenase
MLMATKKHIVIANRDVLPDMIDSLRKEFNVTLTPDPRTKDKESFEQALQSANGLICSMIKLGEEQLADAKNLEAIASVTVGYDNYDLEYLTKRGILLTNTPDVLTEATADTGFALILATARRVVELDMFTRQGRWKRSIEPELFGTNVYGKKLGIIGFGRIGQAVARRGHYGFGMKILYNSTTPRLEAATPLQASFCELDPLLAQSDIICVTVPLTPKTEHLIGEREFNLLRPGTIFVNIARGKVVNQEALIKILQEGKIRAGLDVFEREPLPAHSPLISMSNVVLTPHVGSATQETRKGMAELAIENLRIALAKKRPPNLVNTQVWEQGHIHAKTL